MRGGMRNMQDEKDERIDEKGMRNEKDKGDEKDEGMREMRGDE